MWGYVKNLIEDTVKSNELHLSTINKVLREIISPDSLQEIGMLLGEGGNMWVDYLGALRNIYGILIQPHLDVNSYKELFLYIKSIISRPMIGQLSPFSPTYCIIIYEVSLRKK